MKKIFGFSLFFAIASNAHAAPDAAYGPMYAGTISAQNIGVLHHSISATAINTLGRHAATTTQNTQKETTQTPKDPKSIYGTAPVYGTMPLYGEYGDDGTIFQTGRSGGDTTTQMNAWAAAEHFSDTENFKHFNRTDAKNTFAMVGVGGDKTQIGRGDFFLGAFGGYADSRMRNTHIKLDANGGFIGAYATYNHGPIILAGTTTFGKMFNDKIGDSFDNIWGGIAATMKYSLAIDQTFTIQPALSASYTWIKTDDFNILGVNARTKNTHISEFSPEIRAIKQIADGWTGTIGVKHTLRHTTGGEISLAATKLSALDTRNYTEYGIGIEKSFDNFNIATQISRRDGGRDGWGANIEIKLTF